MSSLIISSLLLIVLCVLHAITAQYHTQPQQQSSSGSSSQSSQYPRIKIGGPLGQLIPNGFQLGAGLGSVLNQLIGQSSGNDVQSSASVQSPFGALRSPFAALQQFGGSSVGGHQLPQQLSSSSSSGSLYGSGGALHQPIPYSSLYSSGSVTSGQKSYSPFGQQFGQSLYNSDNSGLYGSASSPLGMSSMPSGPLMGHSSQLGSTNSELFSAHSALNSQVLGID